MWSIISREVEKTRSNCFKKSQSTGLLKIVFQSTLRIPCSNVKHKSHCCHWTCFSWLNQRSLTWTQGSVKLNRRAQWRHRCGCKAAPDVYMFCFIKMTWMRGKVHLAHRKAESGEGQDRTVRLIAGLLLLRPAFLPVLLLTAPRANGLEWKYDHKLPELWFFRKSWFSWPLEDAMWNQDHVYIAPDTHRL